MNSVNLMKKKSVKMFLPLWVKHLTTKAAIIGVCNYSMFHQCNISALQYSIHAIVLLNKKITRTCLYV